MDKIRVPVVKQSIPQDMPDCMDKIRLQATKQSHRVSSVPRSSIQREQMGETEGAPTPDNQEAEAQVVQDVVVAPSPQLQAPELSDEWVSPAERQMRCEQMGSQPVPVGPRPSVLQRGGQEATEGVMPSVDLQDAKALRAQDDAIPHSPIPDPADATQDSPVEQTPTPDPRRSTRSTSGVAPQRVTYQVRGQLTTYYLPEYYYMIKWLVACDQRKYMKRKFLARPRALVKEIEQKLQLCYCNKSEILNRDWVTDVNLNLHKVYLVIARALKQNKGHSSGLEPARMRGSDAGHMGAGPELSSGQECDGQGLLFSQARSSPVPPVCPAIYQVSAYGSRLVDESVVSSSNYGGATATAATARLYAMVPGRPCYMATAMVLSYW